MKIQVPEYTTRITANRTNRGGVHLEMPKALGDVSASTRIGEQIVDTAKLGAELYVGMKKERDNGIVNDFLNNMSIASTNKLNELKDQYKGANAEGITDAYMRWQDDYLANHMQDMGDDSTYLENEDQIKAARDSIQKNTPSIINNLTNYAAREIENYNNNQYKARLSLLTEQGLNESEENLPYLINNIKSTVANRYSGQSPEFIEAQTRAFTDNILKARLQQDASGSPEKTLARLQSSAYSSVSQSDRDAIEAKAVESWTNKIATRMANAEIDDPNNGITEDDFAAISPYLDKYGKDNVYWQIKDKATSILKKRGYYNKKKKDEEESNLAVDLFNIMEDNSVTPQEKENMIDQVVQNLDPEEAENITSTYQSIQEYNANQDIIETYKDKPDQTAEEKQVFDEAVMKQEEWQDQGDKYMVAQAMEQIDRGYSIDMKNFTPAEQAYLLQHWAGVRNFGKVSDELKKVDKKDSLEKRIDTYYADNFAEKKTDKMSPFLTWAVRGNVASGIEEYRRANNSLPTVADVNAIIADAYTSAIQENPQISALIDVTSAIRNSKAGFQTTTNLKDSYISAISDNDYLNERLDEREKRELADALIKQQYNTANYLVSDIYLANRNLRRTGQATEYTGPEFDMISAPEKTVVESGWKPAIQRELSEDWDIVKHPVESVIDAVATLRAGGEKQGKKYEKAKKETTSVWNKIKKSVGNVTLKTGRKIAEGIDSVIDWFKK